MTENKDIIIGFTGPKLAGKHEMADYLVGQYGFQKLSFSDPLKKACKHLFNFSDEQVYGKEKDVPDPNWFGITPREAMQFIGTDLLRRQMSKLEARIDEDILLRNFRLWYESLNPETQKLIVVPDVRFQNEADFIHERGGVVVKVLYDSTADEVSLLDKILRLLGLNSEHESEAGDVDFDLTINNGCDHTFADTSSQLDAVLSERSLAKLK